MIDKQKAVISFIAILKKRTGEFTMAKKKSDKYMSHDELRDAYFGMVKTLNEDEMWVHDKIIDVIETIPYGFFEEHTLKELNEHFGGHGKRSVNEKLRKTLILAQNFWGDLECMVDIFDTLPEEDEDDK